MAVPVPRPPASGMQGAPAQDARHQPRQGAAAQPRRHPGRGQPVRRARRRLARDLVATATATCSGLKFDLDGQLWDLEHGPRGGDEINMVEPGNNYGWPIRSNGDDYSGDADPRPHRGRRLPQAGDLLEPGDRAGRLRVLLGQAVAEVAQPGADRRPRDDVARARLARRRQGHRGSAHRVPQAPCATSSRPPTARSM